MIRKTIIAIALCLPLLAMGQNEWEVPTDAQSNKAQQAQSGKEYPYKKYLGPVVPEVNGEVVFEKTFTNNKSA